MVQRIKHLHAELELPLFIDWEGFDQSQIQVPVMRCGEDVTAGAVQTRCGNAEGLCQIHATRRHVREGLKENWPRKRQSRWFLKLSFHRLLHTRSSFVTTVSGEYAATDGKWLTRHEGVNRVDRPAAHNLIGDAGR